MAGDRENRLCYTDHRMHFDLETEQFRISSGEMSIASAASEILKLCSKFSANNKYGCPGTADIACINAEVLTDALALNSAKTFEDILLKIDAWMAMAPADAKDVKTASCDELLAYSIMQDVQRLVAMPINAH